VLAGVTGFLVVLASRESDVLTRGAVESIKPDAVDIGGPGRRGTSLFGSPVAVLEKPGRCRLRVPSAGFRGGPRVSAIVAGTDSSASTGLVSGDV